MEDSQHGEVQLPEKCDIPVLIYGTEIGVLTKEMLHRVQVTKWKE